MHPEDLFLELYPKNLGNTTNSLEIYEFILPSLVEKAIKTRFNG
jgi:hypothetical protein